MRGWKIAREKFRFEKFPAEYRLMRNDKLYGDEVELALALVLILHNFFSSVFFISSVLDLVFLLSVERDIDIFEFASCLYKFG